MTDRKPLPTPDYFTIDQIAARWQISTRTVRRKIARKDLIAHRFGAQIRISVEDLRTYEKLNRD